MVITSLENDRVKELVKLQQKKYRDLTNTYLVEGEHLVEEAKIAGVILQVICLEEVSSFYDDPFIVSYEVMKKISSLDSPPKVMAVCSKKPSTTIVGDKILLLDEIQDPGNLGTMIRSSLAFGVSMIILSPRCVDFYHPKVLRATQGMIFHIPVMIMDTRDVIHMIQKQNIPIYGTSVHHGVDVSCLRKEEKDKYCLIMGNEGNGLSSSILSLCDKNLYIPIASQVESLNVGVACSILLYELGR